MVHWVEHSHGSCEIGRKFNLGKRQMTSTDAKNEITYEQFREEWLSDISESNLSSLQKGRRFGAKLMSQWLDVTSDDDDFLILDGSGDGGIDIAYLKRTDADPAAQDSQSEEGDTWYIVQSKYGTSFSGYVTIVTEGQKVIQTLLGQNQHLSGDSSQLLAKLTAFRSQASPSDRIVLIFATTDPIDQEYRPALDTIKHDARDQVFENFDVEEVSLRTIWETLSFESTELSITVAGQFVEQYSGLLVGVVSLIDLFAFLRSYREATGNLDQLYEKNVRQFLGSRRKINRGIATTLDADPEKFGLYNNGITLVVSDYSRSTSGKTVTMNDPYVVNGCQTTRTIWQVLDGKLNSGGTGQDPSLDDWKERASRGSVVTKIVRSEQAEIAKITEFTNRQNSVREQDFIALQGDFQEWQRQMAEDNKIFLEIQRGGTDSRKAYEKQHPEESRYEDYVSAFDLIKVYGAGWLATPGMAFRANSPFVPGGSIYKCMTSRPDTDPSFGALDLFAAYKVKCVADGIGFGRNSNIPSRRLSRFLFYHVTMRMLEHVILLTPALKQAEVTPSALTEAVIKLSTLEAEEPFEKLAQAAVALIDQYLALGSLNTAQNEESYHGDMNGFLKADGLGTNSHSPLLAQSLAIQNAAFILSGGKDVVAKALLEDA